MMLLSSEDGPTLDPSGDAPSSYIDITKTDPRLIVRTLASYGLRVSCVYPGFPLVYSPENIANMIKRFREYRDIA